MPGANLSRLLLSILNGTPPAPPAGFFLPKPASIPRVRNGTALPWHPRLARRGPSPEEAEQAPARMSGVTEPLLFAFPTRKRNPSGSVFATAAGGGSALQARFEGSFGVAGEVVLGEQAPQLVGTHLGGGGEPDAQSRALLGQGAEGIVPFAGFLQAFDDLLLVTDGNAGTFEGLDEQGGFFLAGDHLRLRKH